MRTFYLVLAVSGLVFAACGSGGSDRPTDLGASSETTMGGMAGSEEAEHGASPPAECSPSGTPGTTVSIVASNTKFDTNCLAAPGNQPFTLTYDNRDAVTHNIVFVESHTATDVMFRADIFTGPKTSTFSVPALSPGNYAFHCEVHPKAMAGTLVVK